MDPSTPETSAQNMIASSEIFAIVQQLSSQIDEGRVQHIVETVKDFTREDVQSIVDLFSIALEKHHHLLLHADRVLNLLAEVASSVNVVACNRTLKAGQLTICTSPGVYTVQAEPPLRVQVIKKDTPGMLSKALINWVHLSHPNILPVYGTSLEGDSGCISLVSPALDQGNIVEHAKTLLQGERMPLICDVINGLCYLHHLDIVHGSLNPESVLMSGDGRVLITDLDGSSQTFAVRYLAPEVLENEDTPATKALDVWALGCLCYEVLSGNAPYCQYRQERVAAAVFTRKQPTRPGQQGVKGDEIDDVTWRPVSACWEFEAEDRPSCSRLHDAFTNMNIHDNRPVTHAPSTLETAETPAINLSNTHSLLSRVLGSDQLLSPPSLIPEHLREPLCGLVDSIPRAEALALAAKKLGPDDTQTLVDALDLVLEENPSFVDWFKPVMRLMITIMNSTRIYPQHYKLRRIRYDPSPIAEGKFGKAYKALDLNVCVNVVTNSSDVANIYHFLARWAHTSHPNILPFYGVFDENVDEIPRFCVVTPYTRYGTLYEYAPRLPQKSRLPLISDIINGLHHLPKLGILNTLRPDTVLISDDGRAMIGPFLLDHIVTCTAAATAIRSSTSRAVRFQAPEYYETRQGSIEADIWSFGCLCYEVLSGKSPYHQYSEKDEVEAALTRGEPPERPSPTDQDIEMIDDLSWEMIIGCCTCDLGDRLTTVEIRQMLVNMGIQDERPEAQRLPGTAIKTLRRHPDIKWDRVKELLGQMQVELLRSPLSKLIQNRVKDVAAETVKLDPNDVQTLVDFLDVTLKDHLTISEERNRVLALLSKVMTLAQVFPRRHELEGIKYDPKPIAEGGFGKVHRGRSDPTICVKVTTRVNDPHALVAYIREVVLWAHSSHPNILPFYGVFFDDSQQICLVSPYMSKGNLNDYAPQLPQSSRIPLLLDTIKGLDYLHGLGVVHTDLKGENVLISDDGRGLITDFGASHVVTATANGGATSTSVATTLRYTAPEILQDPTRRVRPTKECDIWSFGCLCYQVLSRKLPYYELQFDAQVFAALIRGQLPKRPSVTKNDTDDDSDDDWDDFDEKDWDDLDDTIWGLIIKCLLPKPGDRPSTSQIQELIVDMKAWDSRPSPKGTVSSVEILKHKSSVEVDLNRAGTLLNHLQILFLARSLYEYSDQQVVEAVTNLDQDDGDTITDLFASALQNKLSTFADRNRLLSMNTAVIVSRQRFQDGYLLRTRPRYHPKVITEGSFGRMYRGLDLDICVKVVDFSQMNEGLEAQWDRALAPWAHSSHPNILPFYGMFFASGGYLVSPFIQNGNLCDHAPRLPQKLRMLLISDVIEGLTYLHNLGIIHGNLKLQNVLVSDEGRGLVCDFRPYHASVAAAVDAPDGSFITSALRFTAPELVKDSQTLPTTASDVWSVGCLVYEVLSRKAPYYKYTSDSEIRSALSRDELLMPPTFVDGDMDKIDDESWDLIMRCCASEPGSRPNLMDVQKLLMKMCPEDKRPAAKTLPGAEIMQERQPYNGIDTSRVEDILNKLKARLPKVAEEGEKDDELDQN